MNISSFDPVVAVLLIPIVSAALLAALPGYRLTARLNVVASLSTFLSALSLFVIERPQPGRIEEAREIRQLPPFDVRRALLQKRP